MATSYTEFENELIALINKYSLESDSDTPDFILGKYLMGCLHNFNSAVDSRDSWYGELQSPSNGMGEVPVPNA